VITGWLLKLVLSFALAALVIYEAGSPLIVRVQLDGVAAAEKAADEYAADRSASVTAFEVTPKRGVVVTLRRIAPSVVLGKWDKTKSYYEVSAEGRSEKSGEL
jgi:hypothetical protein